MSLIYISHIHRFSSRQRNDFFLGFIIYRNIWQENLFEKRPLNFIKVCATGSANGCPLLKLLSNTFVSFTSCCDLDLYHSDFLACSLLARWLLYFQFWSNWVFSGILFCIPRVLLSNRKSCFRPSSDAVPLMCRTKYIFAPRS